MKIDHSGFVLGIAFAVGGIVFGLQVGGSHGAMVVGLSEFGAFAAGLHFSRVFRQKGER